MSVDRQSNKKNTMILILCLAAAAVAVVVVLVVGTFFVVPLFFPAQPPQDKMAQILTEPPPPPPPVPPISTSQQSSAKIISGHSSSQPLNHPKRIPLASVIVNNQVILKTVPIYPPIARAARVSGTVVLHAVISTSGSVIELRAVSGPAMLQQSALDAVKNWKYRPYLLNNEPVEVETTINVIYTLGD